MHHNKLPRREFLQAVTAGGTLLPNLRAAESIPITKSRSTDEKNSPAYLPTDLSLENETLHVSFDRVSGALVHLENKLTGWRIQNRRELARSFVMFAPMPDRHFNPILGEKNKLTSATKSSDGKSLTLVWQNLNSEHAGQLDIKLEATISLDEQGLSFDAEVENRSPYPINSLAWPVVGDLNRPEGAKTLARANMAYAGMQEVPLYPEFGNERGYFGVDYPIQMVPTPARPFVLVVADKQGLYAGAHDTSSKELIEWTFELKPGYEDSYSSRAPESGTIGGTPSNLVFSVTHFPFAAAGESASLSRVVLQPYQGTWHKGVDVYKRWRKTWFKRPSAPPWARDIHSWQQININSSEDDLRVDYEDLPKIGRDCAKYGVKAIQLVGWNNGGQDRGNPSHDTDPRLGSKEQLRDAIAEIQRLGVNIIMFNKYTWSDITTEWFRKELKSYAALDPYGDYYQYQGYRYQTPTQLAEINPRRFAVMCPNSREWREICAREFRKSIDLGAAGILYDEVQHHGSANYCFSPHHGHPTPANIYAGDALLADEFRKIAAESGRDFLFSGEAPYDLELRQYSLSYFRIGPGFIPLHRYIDPFQPMMIAASGFNDREMINACLLYRFVISYEPYHFKGRLYDFPLTMEYGRKVDALRTRYREYLWDAEFRDTQGAEVRAESGKDLLYTVYGRPESGKRALVIANLNRDRSVQAGIRLEGRVGKLEWVSPENPNPQQCQQFVSIAPRSSVVVLEGRD